MSVVVAAASLALIVLVLWDAFEAVLLPRRVTRSSGSGSSTTSTPGSRGPPWHGACGRGSGATHSSASSGRSRSSC